MSNCVLQASEEELVHVSGARVDADCGAGSGLVPTAGRARQEEEGRRQRRAG